jgi:hypothetical protein
MGLEVFPCTQCKFDFGQLHLTIQAREILRDKKGLEGDSVTLYCPACQRDNKLDLKHFGIFSWKDKLYRWRSAATTGNQIQIGQKLILEIPEERIAIISTEEVCYEAVPVFRQLDGTLLPPRWPVKKEYLDLIESASQPEIIQDSYHIELVLKGIGKVEKTKWDLVPVRAEKPALGENAVFTGIHLAMWPDVPYQAWKRYLLRFGCVEAQRENLYHPARAVNLYAWASKELGVAQADWLPINALGSDQSTRFACVESRPQYVALEFESKNKQKGLCGGVWEVPAAPIEKYPENIVTTIAVDFGTSNTCVAVGRDNEKGFVKIEPCERFLIHGSNLPETLSFADPWPPRQGFGKSKALLPTELITREELDEIRTQAERIKTWKPVVDYGIPSGGRKVEYDEAKHILAEFKWDQRISDGVLRNYAKELQKRYIEFALTFALAQLAKNKKMIGAQVEARFSYPLAFEKQQYDDFKTVLQEVMDTVSQVTGLRVQLEDPRRMVDEARAAARSITLAGSNAFLYVDVGGGSSDVALEIFRESERRQRRYVYIASFQYAGGALLDGLDGGRCLNTSLSTFRRLIREVGNVKELMQRGNVFHPNKATPIENKTDYFYGYLLEFLARLLAAHIITGGWQDKLSEGEQAQVLEQGYRIALYALGNGWGFGELFDPDYARSVFAKELTERTNEILGEAAKKEPEKTFPRVIARVPRGFGERDDLGEYDPKRAVVFGLLEGGHATDEKAEEWTFKTIVGCTTKVGATRVVPWYFPVTSLSARPLDGEVDPLLKGDPLPQAALDCPQEEWPSFHRKLPAPHELDHDLNRVRNDLSKCLANKNWFVQSPFHVLLEKLIKPKLKEMI